MRTKVWLDRIFLTAENAESTEEDQAEMNNFDAKMRLGRDRVIPQLGRELPLETIFKILEKGGNRYARSPKYPCTTHFGWMTFNDFK